MNERNYAILNATVTTLSPLHIGTGRKLMLDYDYVVRGRSTYRLDEAALLDAQQVEDPRVLAQLMRTPPGQLLREADFNDSSLFRYVIPGVPRAATPGSLLLEQIKTGADQPFLPGSSFKGALRTALAWQGWAEYGLRPTRQTIDERSARFAARPVEKALFGEDPNHDLLRALQVSDSHPVAAERLILLNVKVLTARGDSAPIEVEGIRPETQFRLRIKLDWQLFSAWAGERRGFALGGQREWLERLAAILNAHAKQRIHQQRAWYTARSAARPASFYAQMENLGLEDNQFVTQLGWGGGWDSKTLGSRIKEEDEKFFDWLAAQPRLQLTRRGIPRRPGSPFPNSRRVAMVRQKAGEGRFVEVPAAPMGWVLVELT